MLAQQLLHVLVALSHRIVQRRHSVNIFGLVLDLLCNTFVMTLILLELPQEFTVTSRLKRHHAESTGWRLAVVLFFEPVLDPLDPSGDHI